MCRTNTVSRTARTIALAFVLVTNVHLAYAQPPASRNLAWTRVGNLGIAEGLAGLGGGPISAAWYAADGRKLFVQTSAGRVFETSNADSFESWHLNQSPTPSLPGDKSSTRQYRLGRNNLYVTEDGGRTWINLTGLNNVSIVGGGADLLAVNPVNQQEITIANSHGLWRSADGGLTWIGLNEKLPNFPAIKLAGHRSVLMRNGATATWNGSGWIPDAPSTSKNATRERASLKLGVAVSAAISVGGTYYAGTPDGRIFSSHDGGDAWVESPGVAVGSRIEWLWADVERADSALAISGNRLLRTVNGGVFWDDVTGSIPFLTLNAVAPDRSASLIYAATDRGIYAATLSLNDAGAAATGWTSVSSELPAAPVLDIAYSNDGVLTSLLDGYGVYETQSPHRSRGVRLLSGADLTDRAAAPGSLVSVVGAKLQSARNGGVSYPILQGADSSTQMQVPFDSSLGVLSLSLQAGTESWSVPLTVKESAPAIFVDADGAPLITDAETGLVVDTKTALRPGQRVQLMATGLGKVMPEWPTGTPGPAEGAPTVRGTVTAFLDGIPVEVTRAVLASGYIGYYTVELQLPAVVNKGAAEFTLMMNGERSNRVKLYIDLP